MNHIEISSADDNYDRNLGKSKNKSNRNFKNLIKIQEDDGVFNPQISNKANYNNVDISANNEDIKAINDQ